MVHLCSGTSGATGFSGAGGATGDTGPSGSTGIYRPVNFEIKTIVPHLASKICLTWPAKHLFCTTMSYEKARPRMTVSMTFDALPAKPIGTNFRSDRKTCNLLLQWSPSIGNLQCKSEASSWKCWQNLTCHWVCHVLAYPPTLGNMGRETPFFTL